MQYRDIAAMVFVIHNRMQRKYELYDALQDLAREGKPYYPRDVLVRAMKDLVSDVDIEVWRQKLCSRNGNISRLLSMPVMMTEVPMTEGRNMAEVDPLYYLEAIGYISTLPDKPLQLFNRRYQEIICVILNSQ